MVGKSQINKATMAFFEVYRNAVTKCPAVKEESKKFSPQVFGVLSFRNYETKT